MLLIGVLIRFTGEARMTEILKRKTDHIDLVLKQRLARRASEPLGRGAVDPQCPA